MHRVLIFEKNRLVREMLARALNAVTDVEVVYPIRPSESLSDQIGLYDADWVIISEGSDAASVREIISDHPGVGILEVARDGSPVQVKRLEVVVFDMDDVTLDELGEILTHKVSELDQYVDRKESA